MENPKSNQLFKAVKVGAVAKIRDLLASGVLIEATDVNRMTPVMIAALAGQAEAFRVLVEAGANLHALAFDQVDLLDCAAQGGNIEIVRFLLEQGMPVEGHWQPRSQVARRQGHLTPLMYAAINGHVEAVRWLVQAGADRSAKFDGQTPLKMVNGEIRFPNTPGSAERKPQYLEIAALLAETSAGSEPFVNAVALEVEKFAENAQRPTYLQLRQMLSELCGEGRSWRPVPDHGIAAAEVVAFTLRLCSRQKTTDDLQEKVRKAGFHLVLTELWAPGENAELALFPTSDRFAVVAAMGTEGANYGVHNAEVLAWLRDLDQENPFALRYCGHDLVGGAFLGPVKVAKKLSERIVELCPPVLDENFETPSELARALSKGKTFLLRWD